jgi:WD40 repeat protein
VAGNQFTNTNGGFCWSPDGKKLIASQSFGDKIYMLDVFAKTNTPTIYHDEVGDNIGLDLIYEEVCPGPLRDHFAVASVNYVQVWHLGQTTSPEKTFYCDKNLNLLNISKLNWSRDGSTLVALFEGDDDHLRAAFWRGEQLAAHIVNMPARSPHYTFFRLVDTVAWSPIEPHLLLLSNADIAVIADLQKQVLVLAIGILNNTAAPVLSGMSWSPNGRYVAGSYGVLGDNNKARTIDPHIYIWDTLALRKKVSPKSTTLSAQGPTLSFGQQGVLQHTDTIVDVQWSPNGRYLATASVDHKVMVWKVDGAY